MLIHAASLSLTCEKRLPCIHCQLHQPPCLSFSSKISHLSQSYGQIHVKMSGWPGHTTRWILFLKGEEGRLREQKGWMRVHRRVYIDSMPSLYLLIFSLSLTNTETEQIQKTNLMMRRAGLSGFIGGEGSKLGKGQRRGRRGEGTTSQDVISYILVPLFFQHFCLCLCDCLCPCPYFCHILFHVPTCL